MRTLIGLVLFGCAACGGGGGAARAPDAARVADAAPTPADAPAALPDAARRDAARPADGGADGAVRADAMRRADGPRVPDGPAGAACDPVVQTGCTSAMAGKCTLVDPGTGNGNVRACVPVTGAVTEGAACMRESETAAAFGHDDCAPGLACTYIGVVPPRAGGTRLCRRFCHVDGDCAGQRCAQTADAVSGQAAVGFCGPTCTPFPDNCPSGMSCSDLWQSTEGFPAFFATCRIAGGVAAQMGCQKSEDCQAGLVCFALAGLGKCTPPCDAAHPCAVGQCMGNDPPNTFGVCL